MIENGFFKIAMPEANIIEDLSWEDTEGFYQQLSKRSRQHFREDVRKYMDKFNVSVVQREATTEDMDYWYQLYQNVKGHSLELNTFPLPRKVFSVLLHSDGWEVLVLNLKQQADDQVTVKPVCMVFCYQSGDAYIPMIIGMDYAFNKEFKIYRQALYRLVMRAKELGKKKIYLGFSAGIEKKKVGAKQIPTFGYMQTKDSFNLETLAGISQLTGGISQQQLNQAGNKEILSLKS